jgi:hypothetical protein
MKLEDGRITMLFNEEGLHIDLFDSLSLRFCAIHLNKEQVCQALSRLAFTHCDIEVQKLENVGKQMIHEYLVFEVSKYHDVEEACKIARELCTGGWVPDLSFNSQDSFFSKDGKNYARTIRRKWVAKNEKRRQSKNNG